ncbi:hypothetical protein CLIB1444_12S03620 [[Candida] jaroonii]|uniref:Uncharacterized protein n=1 Tax=[Candida] jaroonii TaxID=467808 RepID=A0ACA9YDU0_9ASCO|nr:hypothetical protein CLIB1444_12S03620 [[Candida] jaroonii]
MNFQLRPVFQSSYHQQKLSNSHNQLSSTLLVNQFSTIPLGCFKGFKDTRRLKCFSSQCKKNNYRNCKYCKHIPLFSSPLRNIVIIDDSYRWESDSDIFDSESDYSYETDDEIFESRPKSITSSRTLSVDIQLSNLITEIEEFTNENYQPKNNVFQKLVGKLKFKK